jgi:Immunity protein 50
LDVDLLNEVPGGRELVDWFGYAPRFHDAEVLGVTLDREGGTCALRVHGFEMTSEVDAKGYFVCAKHVVVTFIVGGLTAMELSDFNHQNALMGLAIARDADDGFRVSLDAAYGLDGFVAGATLRVSLEPGIPAGSQYLKLG